MQAILGGGPWSGATWAGVLGTAGMVGSTLSMMPQVVRTWRTRSTGDISATWLVVALVSTAIWGIYGVLIEAQAVIWANVACFLQCSSILFVKLRSGRAPSGGQP
jgi:MtN3 and saliva related transmembrane protein